MEIFTKGWQCNTAAQLLGDIRQEQTTGGEGGGGGVCVCIQLNLSCNPLNMKKLY